MFNVLDFGAVGDGTTDDSRAIQAAVSAAGAANGDVFFPPRRYRVKTTIAHAGSSVRLFGPGATLVQAANVPVLDLKGGWEWIAAVREIVVPPAGESLSGGGLPVTRVSQVVLGAAQTVETGDVVKVVSDDVYPDVEPPPNTGGVAPQQKRKGEFAVVGTGSDGTTVTLTGVLGDGYPTNPRLGKLARVSFGLEGLAFDSEDAVRDAPEPHASMLAIAAARDVSIRNVSIVRGWAKGMELRGLYGYTVEGGSYANLLNLPEEGRFGYGIADTACEGGAISGVRFRNCRHGITTATIAVPAGDPSLEYYGRSVHTSVDGCHGSGCSNASFDTHSGAYDWTYSDCTAVANYAGQGSFGIGFDVRGERITLRNCRAYRCQYGFLVLDHGPDGTFDVLLDECFAYGSTVSGVSTMLVPRIGVRVRRLTVRGGVYEGTVNGVGLAHADAVLDGVAVRLIGDAPSPDAIHLTDAAVRFRDLAVHLDAFTGTAAAAVGVADAASSFRGTGLALNRGSAAVAAIARGTAGTGNPNVEIEQLVADAEVEVAVDLGDSWRIGGRITGGAGGSSALIEQTLTGDEALRIGHAPDPVVLIAVETGGASRTLPALPAGFRVGQILVIRVARSAGHTLTLQNGPAFRTDLGANAVLADGDTLVLVWGAGVWVRMQPLAGRQWVEGWYAPGVAAGTTVMMRRGVADLLTPHGWRAPRAGSVTGISLQVPAPVAAGRLDGALYNGNTCIAQGLLFFTGGSAGTCISASFAPGTLSFDAGDVLTLHAVASSDLVPASTAMMGTIEVQLS